MNGCSSRSAASNAATDSQANIGVAVRILQFRFTHSMYQSQKSPRKIGTRLGPLHGNR